VTFAFNGLNGEDLRGCQPHGDTAQDFRIIDEGVIESWGIDEDQTLAW
jgi:hypothetical protein